MDLLAVVSDLFPRLVATVVAIAVLVCPHVVSSMLISAAEERGREVTRELESILIPRGPERDDRDQTIRPRRQHLRPSH